MLITPPSAFGKPPACKGTKQYYKGKCRYSDEIKTLKKAAWSKKRKREREEERKRLAEEKRRLEEAAQQERHRAIERARIERIRQGLERDRAARAARIRAAAQRDAARKAAREKAEERVRQERARRIREQMKHTRQRTTARCGDGRCQSISETQYNCPRDCGVEKPYTTVFANRTGTGIYAGFGANFCMEDGDATCDNLKPSFAILTGFEYRLASFLGVSAEVGFSALAMEGDLELTQLSVMPSIRLYLPFEHLDFFIAGAIGLSMITVRDSISEIEVTETSFGDYRVSVGATIPLSDAMLVGLYASMFFHQGGEACTTIEGFEDCIDTTEFDRWNTFETGLMLQFMQ
jgi:hypothetical protein